VIGELQRRRDADEKKKRLAMLGGDGPVVMALPSRL
jgi:hypothetical protein